MDTNAALQNIKLPLTFTEHEKTIMQRTVARKIAL